MSAQDPKRTKMTELTFVSGNPGKIKELFMMLGEEFRLRNEDIDLPELQGEPEETIGGPVIVEDTSLCFNALGGLPGPYIKWFLKKLGTDGLNKLIAGFEDKTAYALCVFSYCEGPGKKPIVFAGKTPGRIVPPRGPGSFGWDPIFEPEGFTETFAEMSKETKNTISHRKKAVEQLRQYLVTNNLFRK